MLYPQASASRMLFSLDGVWKFCTKAPGAADLCPLQDARPMPVPAAYNDIGCDAALRDYVGEVIYERTFSVSAPMLQGRLVLRFGSVTHRARVYVNGNLAAQHTGGFLPFEAEISPYVKVGTNTLRVIVDNILDFTTLPVGRLVENEYPGLGKTVENLPNFDFFNYAGILRPVHLYTTPHSFIETIRVRPSTDGTVEYQAACSGSGTFSLTVLDEAGETVAVSQGVRGTFVIRDPVLWQPGNAYLYRLCAHYTEDGCTDEYELPFGIRSVEVKDCRFLINGQPFYFKGFGKHEDSHIHGRGFDEALNVKDISLMQWIGANSFRTSHYPYSEEMMRLADRLGIVVIDEVPAVGLHTNFMATGLLDKNGKSKTWSTLQTEPAHRQAIRELIHRDEAYACVVMWSIANEPASEEVGAREYFQPLYELAKECDWQKRPVTIVTYEGSKPENCQVAGLVDVLAINRYYGWYNYCGDLHTACAVLKDELDRWHRRFPDKPMMFCEYGADTIPGLHAQPAAMFTEEFQAEFLQAYHALFDALPWFVGEHVWNFSDFATAQNTMRVMGNKKGIFTRERQPKMAAYVLRQRWTTIPNFGYKK